jgi:16S rRNA (cytidine1402-2'-O)-methyltransferase
MSTKGKLYLIPTTLGDTGETLDVIPQKVYDIVNTIDEYIVEHEKSARQYLKKIGIQKSLQEITLHPLNQHTSELDISDYLNAIDTGKDIGIISDAGCPGIADPGAEIVKIAHQRNITIIPLVGPSSILLSLMASGFNGQNFAFNGYLPKDQAARIKTLKDLEQLAHHKKQTQLFIETPYRNMHLLEDIITHCKGNTLLCIACDITLETEYIKTQSVHDWKKKLPEISKRPAIFLIYS